MYKAYNTFCRGGVIPLVIGAYGNTNEDFQEVLKVCARMVVARGDAVYNSPIFETEVKGGAYFVTLHLYRRSIAGAIACPRSLSTQEITTALCSRLERRGC